MKKLSKLKKKRKTLQRRVQYWKHGIPSNNKVLDDRVVDIFIFRNLNDWLLSFHHTQYSLE